MNNQMEVVTLYFVAHDANGQHGTNIEQKQVEKNTARALCSWYRDSAGAWFRTHAEAVAYCND